MIFNRKLTLLFERRKVYVRQKQKQLDLFMQGQRLLLEK